jgi:hypothetical protein
MANSYAAIPILADWLCQGYNRYLLVRNERFQRVIATPGAEQVLPGQERLYPDNRSTFVLSHILPAD